MPSGPETRTLREALLAWLDEFHDQHSNDSDVEFRRQGRELRYRLIEEWPAALAVPSESSDPTECAICGDYTVGGVEVHEPCLDMLSRIAATGAKENPDAE